jgi:hypothetical protein
MIGFMRRCFSKKLEITPYFAITDSIEKINFKYRQRGDLPDASVQVKCGGRIIGRRKASGTLMFLDLESNGSQV